MTSTKNDEAWQKYLNTKGIVFDQPTYFVDADELHQITGREPRLLAKFDTPDQLAQPLRRAGYTLLPIKNGQYQLVRGDLFVPLPTCNNRSEYQPQTPFPLATEGRGHGESQYIDQAFNSGLLNHFLNIDQMYQTIRGREYTRRFSFQWADQELTVESVQIEVDAGYEALHDIVLIEAKIGIPTHFNIRQLYYPFRHFSTLVPQKHIRTLFMGYDLPSSTYHLYEYNFPEEKDMLSSVITRCEVYRVAPIIHKSIYDLQDVRFQTSTTIVPQADDLNKVYELLSLVEAGINSSNEVADYFGFDRRQSNYYREAAEYLGLLTFSENYELTERGIVLLSEPASTQALFFAKTIVNSWIFVDLVRHSFRQQIFTNSDIEQIVRSAGDGHQYSGSTVPRRRSTIVAWIRWLAQGIGCFAVEGETYRIE